MEVSVNLRRLYAIELFRMESKYLDKKFGYRVVIN